MTTLYNVVKADTPEQLEVQVMEYLEKGWKPQGGMQVVLTGKGPDWDNLGYCLTYTFFQAMVSDSPPVEFPTDCGH